MKPESVAMSFRAIGFNINGDEYWQNINADSINFNGLA